MATNEPEKRLQQSSRAEVSLAGTSWVLLSDPLRSKQEVLQTILFVAKVNGRPGLNEKEFTREIVKYARAKPFLDALPSVHGVWFDHGPDAVSADLFCCGILEDIAKEFEVMPKGLNFIPHNLIKISKEQTTAPRSPEYQKHHARALNLEKRFMERFSYQVGGLISTAREFAARLDEIGGQAISCGEQKCVARWVVDAITSDLRDAVDDTPSSVVLAKTRDVLVTIYDVAGYRPTTRTLE